MDKKVVKRARKSLKSPRVPNTPMGRYESAVDEYKGLLADKTHPKNRTPGYKQMAMGVLNRLVVAANHLEDEDPGGGFFGLLILSLRTHLSLREKNIELEVRVRDLERKINRMEKR